jgi:FAD/FMN-containing dehydrogenase
MTNYFFPMFTSPERLAPLAGFGRAVTTAAYLYRPTHPEQIAELFRYATQHHFTIAARGAGRSYGDAALNAGQIVLDLQRMTRILAWDPHTGVITAEPGVTLEQLWKYVVEDGWWPPVMSGTMFPTLGGALGMNIHGKNNYRAGPIGEHVAQFTALLPKGEEITCSPTQNPDLFYGMIGGLGVLGVFTSITLQMKHIYSGDVNVHAWAPDNLRQMFDEMEPLKSEADYLVGWVDGTATGKSLGRGQIHTAHYLKPGEDPAPARTLRVDYQVLPDTLFGFFPKSMVWLILRLGMNNLGVTVGNTAKFLLNRALQHHHHFREGLVAFNFLLDYVPRWQYAYGSRGFIQYQNFIPRANAADAFSEMLRRTHKHGLPNYLAVTKRHRPDKFLLSHAVDGYSMAMDFKIPSQPARLQRLTDELGQIALEAGGRFYGAKDSTLRPAMVARYLGSDTLNKFRALKHWCDPRGILQTDLWRRWNGATPFTGPAPSAPPVAALAPA